MIGKLIDLAARHRWLVILAWIAIAIGAVSAARRVPLDAIPDLSDPQVIVFTEWKGRSPTLIEDQVTYPIASSLLAAPKVSAVRGYSMFGMSFVYVLFEEGTDLYWARSRVLEYLATNRDRLPEGVSPTLGPDATGIGWVHSYALVDRSGKHDLAELRTLQDFTLRYALESVPGVAQVAAVGGYERQYQVNVDPEKLRSHGLSVDDIGAAISRSNREVGGRVIELSGREYFVRGRGYLGSLDDIELNRAPRGPAREPLRIPGRGGSARKAARSAEAWPSSTARRDRGGHRRGPARRERALGHRTGRRATERSEEDAASGRRDRNLQPEEPHRSRKAIDTLKSALIEEGVVVSVVIVFLLHLRSAFSSISTCTSVVTAFIPCTSSGCRPRS
ncbi:MAG: efflux RND transporter permease subunit [Polyangiaceae bacterium]